MTQVCSYQKCVTAAWFKDVWKGDLYTSSKNAIDEYADERRSITGQKWKTPG